MTSLFACRDVSIFKGEEPFLTEVSFSVAQGQTFVLEAPNGGGKTSLLESCAGLHAIREGHFLWKGEACRPPQYQMNLNYLGHKNALEEEVSVFDNLLLSAGLSSSKNHKTHQQRRHKVNEVLERFSLDLFAAFPLHLLSAGQKRRVALARLGLFDTEEKPLWILDEPTTALDHSATAFFTSFLEEHCHKGGAVIMSTHHALSSETVQTLDLSPFSWMERAL